MSDYFDRICITPLLAGGYKVNSLVLGGVMTVEQSPHNWGQRKHPWFLFWDFTPFWRDLSTLMTCHSGQMKGLNQLGFEETNGNNFLISIKTIKMFRNYRWIVGELKCPQRNVTWFSRWWFQPNWKNISQHGNLPQIGNRGENQKYLKSPSSSFTMLQALWKKGPPITRNSSPFSRDEWAL